MWEHIGTTSPSTVHYRECMLLCVPVEKAEGRCLSRSVKLEVVPLAVGCWKHRCENVNRSEGLDLDH